MEGNQVGDEDITTPSRDHIPIKQSSQGSPHNRTVLDRFDPKIEGKDQKEDGYRFIVVTTSYGSRNITWRYTHESGG